MQFNVERSVMDSGVSVLTLSGPMTMTNQIHKFEWMVEELAKNHQNRIVVDMSQISHVDSSAIGVLVGSHLLVKDSGGQLRLAAVTDRVRMVLHIAGVENVLHIDPTTSDALSALSLTS